jgi:hypothetical protein
VCVCVCVLGFACEAGALPLASKLSSHYNLLHIKSATDFQWLYYVL